MIPRCNGAGRGGSVDNGKDDIDLLDRSSGSQKG